VQERKNCEQKNFKLSYLKTAHKNKTTLTARSGGSKKNKKPGKRIGCKFLYSYFMNKLRKRKFLIKSHRQGGKIFAIFCLHCAENTARKFKRNKRETRENYTEHGYGEEIALGVSK
jgi:hypothetical protein